MLASPSAATRSSSSRRPKGAPRWGLADGLGHGPKAAEASVLFCERVRKVAREGPLTVLHDADRALAATRGAVGVVVRVDCARGLLKFAGIGNIESDAQI